jgi:prepilin-type N-terminal cleavage/methylation domain-containing protein
MIKKTQAGYTLIELLLVITLVAISVGVTSDVLLSLIRSYNKTSALNEVEQQANFIGSKIEKELRDATNISTPTSNRLSFSYNGATVYYNVADNNLYRSTTTWSTSAADALVATPAILGTAGGVNLSCDGSCFTLEGSTPQIVGLSMIFSESGAGGISFTGEIHIKNTIVVRNSY